jgi:putative nucleotidyltransferase with HDIG domain
MGDLIEQVDFQTVAALADISDAKGRYTAGHSRRVMQYSLYIACNMDTKVAEKDIQLLRNSALLHDIGKIGIPDAILHKGSDLTDEEYAVIKAHPEIGANILKSVEAFKDLVPAVYCHHERFDGKGYPRGIQGEDIPLNARIISVANSFDAMTSDRRNAFTYEAALAEIERNKGIQFDPRIANIFIGLFKEESFPYYFNLTMEPEYFL